MDYASFEGDSYPSFQVYRSAIIRSINTLSINFRERARKEIIGWSNMRLASPIIGWNNMRLASWADAVDFPELADIVRGRSDLDGEWAYNSSWRVHPDEVSQMFEDLGIPSPTIRQKLLFISLRYSFMSPIQFRTFVRMAIGWIVAHSSPTHPRMNCVYDYRKSDEALSYDNKVRKVIQENMRDFPSLSQMRPLENYNGAYDTRLAYGDYVRRSALGLMRLESLRICLPAIEDIPDYDEEE